MWAEIVTIALFALSASVAALAKDRDMLVVSLALLANWAACVVFSEMANSVLGWSGLFGIDFLTASGIAIWYMREHVTRREPLIVIGIYVAMLLCHSAFSALILSGVDPNAGVGRTYFIALTICAWGQALTTGGGVAVEYFRRRNHRRDVDRSASAAEILRRSVDGK